MHNEKKPLMKNIIFLVITFISFGCNSQEQDRMFEQQEKKAKEFMESKISEIYNDQFKTEFIGTWHEFGKVYGFKFYLIENNDNPIVVEYDLGNQNPFEFDKSGFEEEYESIKIKVRASEELENNIKPYFPNSRAIANRIKNQDGTYRWVNNIYTAEPLNEKEKVLKDLDSLSKSLTKNVSGERFFYNFYFPKESDKTKYSDNRFTFFEFENFNQKHIFHYRIDFEKNEQEFKKTNQKLYDNLNDELSKELTESIEKWKNQNSYKNWEISLLNENSIERDLDYKKFMLSSDGEKIFGFINIESKELKLVE
jgi:hypothetical protein